MKARFEDPEYRKAHIERATAGTRRAMKENPAFAEMRRELGKACGLKGLGFNRHGPGTPERVAAGKNRSNTVLAWCPPEYRDEYMVFVRSKLMRAPEAQRLICLQIAADIKKHEAGLLPLSEFQKVRSAMRYLAQRNAS
jgi:hypothetical protein